MSDLIVEKSLKAISETENIASFSIIRIISGGITSFLFSIISFFAYSIPSFFITLLGKNISITLSFSSLLLAIFVFAASIAAIVRYRYLTIYSRLKSEPYKSEPNIDIFHSYTEDDLKQGFSSYIDEILSAIKIFGYLDRKVFHELTRQIQTCKLDAGDIMRIDEETGFCIVVDGHVQIFVKSGDATKNDDFLPFETNEDVIIENNEKYNLLTDVKTGAPMSSLFSILSLFVENDPSLKHSARDSPDFAKPANYDLYVPPIPFLSDSVSNNDSQTPLIESEANLKESGSFHSIPPKETSPLNPSSDFPSYHGPTIISRAKKDSSIAIIPASAFRRLTKIYPKSAAHIVQVIMDRFQRVTFQTGHKYLGLTQEIFQTEISLNEHSKYDLSMYLRDGALERLKDRFNENKDERNSSQDGKGTILFKHKTGVWQQHPTTSIRDESSVFLNKSHQVILDPNITHPGDILTSVPLSKIGTGSDGTPNSLSKKANFHINSFKNDYETEEAIFKQAIADKMFQFLGLDTLGSIGSHKPNPDSAPFRSSGQSSPRFSAVSDFNTNKSHERFRMRLNSQSAASQTSFSHLHRSESLSSMTSEDTYSVDGVAITAKVRQVFESNIQIVHYSKGTTIIKQGYNVPGLYYVINGFLDVYCADSLHSNRQNFIYTVNPGGVAGFLAAISSHKSFVNVKAKTDVYLGMLPVSCIENVFERYPVVLFNIAKRLIGLLPKIILHLDYALEWLQIEAGQSIYRKGEDADSIHVVLNGRLRALIQRNDGRLDVLKEFGHGESIGELEALTMASRPYTLTAIRDTEVAKIPRALFEYLSVDRPKVTFQITRLIAARLKTAVNDSSKEGREIKTQQEYISHNIKTITILPINDGVPINEFSQRLLLAFSYIGQNTLLLTQASILTVLGRHAFTKMGKLKLSTYLADIEERYDTILYVCDTGINSPWMRTCVSQADCILMTALADGSSSISNCERFVLSMKTTANKELVLVHPELYVSPGTTHQWLRNRNWIHRHHHIQISYVSNSGPPISSIANKIANLRNKMQVLHDELQKYATKRAKVRRKPIYATTQVHKSDFARLARLISGKAVGLVLGGGGARGIAHIGVIQAFEEEGIPIDIVGGTSIGSFVGGLYARESDVVPIYGRAKQFAGRAASFWRLLLDLTYPATAYLTGHEFNRGIWKAFKNWRIEDFWLPFYANTTNITHSRMEIHTHGYAWRYIRASMSLAGLLPPITDDGSMLLDGGYVDNLTVAYMKKIGAEVIWAIDVGSMDDTSPMMYGDTLSGFWVVFNRWNPFSKHPNIPNFAEIQARLAYVSSVGALEKAKTMPGCIYMRPPIDNYATLDFAKFDAIYQVGYQYGKKFIAGLKKKKQFPKIAGMSTNKDRPRTSLSRRNSI